MAELILCMLLWVIFLPGKYAMRYVGMVILLLLVWYELTPPTPWSRQNISYTMGFFFAVWIVVAFLIVAGFKIAIHLGLRQNRGEQLFTSSEIDKPLLGIVGLIFGFFTFTISSRIMAYAPFDIIAHIILFSLTVAPTLVFLKTNSAPTTATKSLPRHYFMIGFSSMVLIGLAASIWHISSVTNSAKLLSGNKAYCITKIKNLMDLSFLTMKKFSHPNLVIQGNKNNTVLTWSFRQQKFLQAYGQLQCKTKHNFIEKLPIF